MSITDVLQTQRLVLRRQTPDDAPFVARLMNDADFLLHVGDRGVRTEEDARSYILDGAVASYERLGFGLYLVETKGDGVPVGICGLVKRDFLDDADLGFALAPEHRGHGYAGEAAVATVKHARTVLGLEQLAAIVSPANAASIRLLRDLGFAFHRVLEPTGGDLVHVYLLAAHDARNGSPGESRLRHAAG